MTKGVYLGPLGCWLLVEQSGEMVSRICFSNNAPDEPSVLAAKIADYLIGRAPCPKAELDLSRLTDFERRISAIVQDIPRGETATYGEVAKRAGRPGAARAVGQVMAKNPFAILVPCHRVVSRKDLGGFAWGPELKERLLALERGPP
ncbi:MAG: Methylated-DNA--protein-cysteine methyltransferase [Methanosaeta sp. PtaU1.Bin060]|nr:MAG: Methylated-DNA--protein-cysteine methyltransferase [Methanosaeta sp. PtaU1.Bin060]